MHLHRIKLHSCRSATNVIKAACVRALCVSAYASFVAQHTAALAVEEQHLCADGGQVPNRGAKFTRCQSGDAGDLLLSRWIRRRRKEGKRRQRLGEERREGGVWAWGTLEAGAVRDCAVLRTARSSWQASYTALSRGIHPHQPASRTDSIMPLAGDHQPCVGVQAFVEEDGIVLGLNTARLEEVHSDIL